MPSMIERIAEAEEKGSAIKKQAAADARERAAKVQAMCRQSIDAAKETAREKLVNAETEAEAEGESVYNKILAQNGEEAEKKRAAAAFKLNSAADYIVERAFEA